MVVIPFSRGGAATGVKGIDCRAYYMGLRVFCLTQGIETAVGRRAGQHKFFRVEVCRESRTFSTVKCISDSTYTQMVP